MHDIWIPMVVSYIFISFFVGLFMSAYSVEEKNVNPSHIAAWVIAWPLFGSIWLARALWSEFKRAIKTA